jgi:hypothetical protein
VDLLNATRIDQGGGVMPLTAMWTHGHSFAVENPEHFTKVARFGFGLEVQLMPQREAWFHAPIPTPVFLIGHRPKLLRVLVLFKTNRGQARLEKVHLFDSDRRIRIFEERLISGNLLTPGKNNTFALSPPVVVGLALGVSIMFRQRRSSNTPVFIASVGADFESP